MTAQAPTELAARLTGYLARQTGDATARVGGLSALAGGASREIWAFDATFGGRTKRLVLRRDPPGDRLESRRGEELRLLAAAAAGGVPVPRVHWGEDDPSVLGAPFFVMDFVEGETLARRLLRDAEYADARRVLPGQLAQALARIHALDSAASSLAFLDRPARGAQPSTAELARWEARYREVTLDAHPVLELALRWLSASPPAAARLRVVHGDFRIGNVIFGPEGLRAVLDWELARVGDPMEDLGWLCVRAWRFGAALPVGGLCEREPLFAAYEASGGLPVDRTAVRWWEVFGNLKWAVICLVQARAFLDGETGSVELASLGRRVGEMELELLELTEA